MSLATDPCSWSALPAPNLARLEKAAREEKDTGVLNAQAARLNKEACDVLEYQGLP